MGTDLALVVQHDPGSDPSSTATFKNALAHETSSSTMDVKHDGAMTTKKNRPTSACRNSKNEKVDNPSDWSPTVLLTDCRFQDEPCELLSNLNCLVATTLTGRDESSLTVSTVLDIGAMSNLVVRQWLPQA